MKAGIYQTPNGNLIYVAKDRTIKATTLTPSSWPGAKVSHRSKDDTVLIVGTDYRCKRVGDVPNGCNDFLAELHAVELRLAEDFLNSEDALKLLSVEGANAHRLNGATITKRNPNPLDHLQQVGRVHRADKQEPPAVVFADSSTPGDDIYKSLAHKLLHQEHITRRIERPRALAMPYGAGKVGPAMISMGWRRVHKQSARKHRKAGHLLIPDGNGAFWWKKLSTNAGL